MDVLLNNLLQYKNTNIIDRYKKDFQSNLLNAEIALEELLKFFWLSNKHKIDKRNEPNNSALEFECVIHKEMSEMDDMWHTFLLFTKDYMSFCRKYFKNYIHHMPATQNRIKSEEEYTDELTKYLSYIYDNLGEETLIKWFDNPIKQ